MLVKSKLIVVSLAFACVLILSSCLHSETYSDEANMTSFYLVGFPDSSYTFVIDENQKTISNVGYPLPFETNLTAVVPVFKVSENAYVYGRDSLYPDVIEDSVAWKIEISGYTRNDFTHPGKLRVISQSGNASKDYTVEVYTSNVNPNEIALDSTLPAIGGATQVQNLIEYKGAVWYFASNSNGTSGQILKSTDLGKTWTTSNLTIPATSQYKVAAFNDSIYIVDATTTYVSDGTNPFVATAQGGKTNPYLMVDEDDNQLVAISGQDASISFKQGTAATWTDTVNASQPLKPVLGAGSVYVNGQILLVGGGAVGTSNTSFADNAGARWATLKTPTSTLIDPIVFYYSARLWSVGGVDETGATTRKIYYSYDGGLTWKEDTRPNLVLPSGYNRAGGQAIVDSNNNLWLVGGYSQNAGATNKTYYSDVLVGKMNVITSN